MRRPEQVPVVFPPVVNALQRLANAQTRLPTGMGVELRDVGYVNELVARPRGIELVLEAPSREGFNFAGQLQQRGRVSGSAAHVVDLAGGLVAILTNGIESANQVFDAEHVADLAAIAVDDERHARK